MPKGLHVLPGIEFCSELGGSFRSCRGLFRGTFCRSAMPLALARTLWLGMTKLL